MSKLRVGIIYSAMNDQQAGGGFTYYDSLIHAIDSYDFEESIEFVYLDISSTNPHAARKFRKELICINMYSSLSRREKLICSLAQKSRRFAVFRNSKVSNRIHSKKTAILDEHLYKQLRFHKIDLLYFLFPHTHFIDYPFVETHWDIGHYSMFPFPEVSMNGQFEERENYYTKRVQKAFAVFCESNAGKQELIDYKSINKERVFVVPLFAGKVAKLNLSHQEVQNYLKDYGLRDKSFFFYPAQFWAHKNHYGLILAFKKISEEYQNVKLVLSGSDQGNLGYIKSIVQEYSLETKVIITGFVSNEAVYAFYKGAIALVMPTYLGPTNIPLLEAQEIGCRIICSDFPGHRELLEGYNALFVAPYDTDGLFNNMKAMCDNEDANPNGHLNIVFNLENSIKCIEQNFLKIKNQRKTFGIQ